MTREELIIKLEKEYELCDKMINGINRAPLTNAFIEGKKSTILIVLEAIKKLENVNYEDKSK